MSPPAITLVVDEAQLANLAARLAARLETGDCVALRGDLGAGKTTFARALIRALLDDPAHDVPSPTFPLRQDYVAALGAIAHFDFYRLGGTGDLDEIGFDEAVDTAIVIVEWPERAVAALPTDRIDVVLADTATPEQRAVTVSGAGRAADKIAKLASVLRHRPL